MNSTNARVDYRELGRLAGRYIEGRSDLIRDTSTYTYKKSYLSNMINLQDTVWIRMMMLCWYWHMAFTAGLVSARQLAAPVNLPNHSSPNQTHSTQKESDSFTFK